MKCQEAGKQKQYISYNTMNYRILNNIVATKYNKAMQFVVLI